MEIRELRSLALLAELGSITQTAERIHLSAAAIHKQLKVLEDELGVRLYEKHGRQLRLTQAAQILLPHIQAVLAQYDATLGALSEWKGLKRGLVRVGTGPTASSYILPPLLEEYRRLFPEVELFVETGNTEQLLDALAKGALDLTILVSSDLLNAPGFSVEATWNFEIVLVSGVNEFPRSGPLSSLQTVPFILYKKGSIFENLIDRYFAEGRFHPRVIMRFDNPEATKAMVRTGLGISMLPMWTVASDIKDKKLRMIRQKERPLIAQIALVTRKMSYMPQPVEAFIQVAKSWKWKNTRLLSRSKQASSSPTEN